MVERKQPNAACTGTCQSQKEKEERGQPLAVVLLVITIISSSISIRCVTSARSLCQTLHCQSIRRLSVTARATARNMFSLSTEYEETEMDKRRVEQRDSPKQRPREEMGLVIVVRVVLLLLLEEEEQEDVELQRREAQDESRIASQASYKGARGNDDWMSYLSRDPQCMGCAAFWCFGRQLLVFPPYPGREFLNTGTSRSTVRLRYERHPQLHRWRAPTPSRPHLLGQAGGARR